MKFSERMGYVPVERVLQTEGVDDALRNSIWNAIDRHIWTPFRFHEYEFLEFSASANRFSESLWRNYFKERADSRPGRTSRVLDRIREEFFRCEWYEVYDFVEFVVSYAEDPELVQELNEMLAREFSGFRLIDGQICPITDETALRAVEDAASDTSGPFLNAQVHLRQAMRLLAQRRSPDFRNSIKESISAVESVASELSGKKKATLGEALKVLEREGHLHPALRNGFSAIYGCTSNADGIRHALLEEAALDVDDATYFLVSCAAFINYLKAKHAAAI